MNFQQMREFRRLFKFYGDGSNGTMLIKFIDGLVAAERERCVSIIKHHVCELVLPQKEHDILVGIVHSIEGRGK